ncbi:restriction endonuclease subunit S [Arsenophonus sp.]|uniref:restriction endonuclease subunit S n=1 Tax=Arsenophonus sp. TaxID=1872640 RepID=UPI0038796DF1
MNSVEWGEFNVEKLFGKSTRGKRLKSDDRIPGDLPFVTAGESNEGVSAFIGNNVTVFSENTTTIDMFGSAKYRNYKYGADDHVAVVHTEKLSRHAAIFITSAIHKSSYTGMFDYGRNFYAKDADQLNIFLPSKNYQPDYEFMGNYIAELEAERIAELEAYLTTAGLKDYELTPQEQKALDSYQNLEFIDFKVTDIFTVKNSGNILSRDIVKNSGNTPYLCASRENNSVSSYISYDSKYLDNGNCIFIGGKTFVVTYQEYDFYSNDSHNLILYLKNKNNRDKLTQLYLATCINKSLGHKYSWGDSISNKKIQKDRVVLPVNNGQPDLSSMATLISAIQKLVIKDFVLFAERKITAHKQVVKLGVKTS